MKDGRVNGSSLANVKNASWHATLTNGTAVPLRVDTAQQGAGSNSDVGLYAVSFETATGWEPLCGLDEAGAPILAVAVPGTWSLASGSPGDGAYTPSTTVQSFACRGKTIAKCVELGYKPWNGRTDQLAACVRLLRADYCGDGRSYTVNGTLVNLYDNAGVLVDDAAWTKEAAWSPAGAVCIAKDADDAPGPGPGRGSGGGYGPGGDAHYH